MIRSGTIKPVFLLALGIIAITLVEFPAGATGDCMDRCLDNETCMMLQSSAEDCQSNKTTTCCMIDDHLTNESCYMADVDQNVSTAQARLNCTDYWLEKAIELHELHLEDPSTATNKSQMELMDHMMHAHECITGENVTMEMMNCTTAENISVNSTSASLARLNCADFWLEQAIKLHEMHLKNPSTATNESQMKMMEQMMSAHECIIGTCIGMEMTDQARMDCASASLKKAMELHMLHMKEYCTATNESQMKLMEQMMEHMMNAYECMTGENMTTGVMNKTIMEMTGQERMDCASASLKMAMEMHELHMKEHMDMNESEMEIMEQMMEQMMQAYECMSGENMAMGMMNDTAGVQFLGEHEHRC